jgi:putative addiction module killer protein
LLFEQALLAEGNQLERSGEFCAAVEWVAKATLGNFGDAKPVGEGVFEMREHFGPGWRMCASSAAPH